MAFKNLREDLEEEFAELSGFGEVFERYAAPAARAHDVAKERCREYRQQPSSIRARRARRARMLATPELHEQEKARVRAYYATERGRRQRSVTRRKRRLVELATPELHERAKAKQREIRRRWRAKPENRARELEAQRRARAAAHKAPKPARTRKPLVPGAHYRTHGLKWRQENQEHVRRYNRIYCRAQRCKNAPARFEELARDAEMSRSTEELSDILLEVRLLKKKLDGGRRGAVRSAE
jgi:hypothetical protein